MRKRRGNGLTREQANKIAQMVQLLRPYVSGDDVVLLDKSGKEYTDAKRTFLLTVAERIHEDFYPGLAPGLDYRPEPQESRE